MGFLMLGSTGTMTGSLVTAVDITELVLLIFVGFIVVILNVSSDELLVSVMYVDSVLEGYNGSGGSVKPSR